MNSEAKYISDLYWISKQAFVDLNSYKDFLHLLGMRNILVMNWLFFHVNLLILDI